MTPHPPSPDLALAKAQLRQQLTTARARLEPGVRATACEAITRTVCALPAWGEAGVVALYAASGGEVETAALAAAAVRAGKTLAWPVIVAGDRRLSFAAAAPEALVAGPFGIRRPPPGAPAVARGEIGLFLVPGVGFDLACERLGRGAGFYDATLAAVEGKAERVGLAFDLQVVDALPRESHDVALDAVVTETRLLRPPAPAEATVAR
ncbi:5-formyltetrahydrofolate cyclo-ligase [Anaeromyxobacter paludicola]|uniref:5-formyltetrahydrofolate cyclo-ligase n=1 Tax=Anaeromyxobacter paludicola TaxID=2918171 RepID=A0ABM7X988_9BACT|nr:5-formyltetrahydrofolate cyclo-ligase [Anaeromyxobacter paludicola]BDG08370.1 5-formyltetrahydrofolate cyclo-ligase [Anaeromyxobacter paludicola]